MSDITLTPMTLTPITVPTLPSSGYGDNITEQFGNIDSNFKQIVEGEYLKGQSGDLVMLEEIDLTSDSDICTKFYDFLKVLFYEKNKNDEENEEIVKNIKKSIGDGNEEDDINSSKLYMIYTLNQENGEKIYKTSLPYTFLDPRFNPVSNSAKDENLEDKSCIIIYDGEGFVSYNAFPNIYFNGDQNEFCWKINGLETSLPARGPKGDTGYAGAVYILSAILPEGYDLQKDPYVRVKFLITPPKYSEVDGPITNEVASELKGQAAFVYANVTDNNGNNKQYIYISQIVETSTENGDTYAMCLLDNSCEIHQIFANQTLKDVLTEVKPDSGFNYLFIPSINNGVQDEAHVVTTKRAGDIIQIPKPGFWWKIYNSNDWTGLNDPNICIVSPALLGPSRILKEHSWQEKENYNILYNNYKTNICPGDAYFGKIATGTIHFDDNTGQSNKWMIVHDQADNTLKIGRFGEDKNYVKISDSTLGVAKNLSVGENATIANTLTSGSIILLNIMKNTDGANPSFILDATESGMRLSDLNVQHRASIAELETLNYKVPSLDLLNTHDLNVMDDIAAYLVYLTWNYLDTDRDIPTITDSQGEKKFLQAGKPKYIINTTDVKGNRPIHLVSTDIHLSFDMSRDWPPTQIEWNFGRTPKTISFANGKVKIYTDFRINTNGVTDNFITVQNGVSGIDFTNYIGELNGITSILLTPYDAASTPDYKAYKLTLENTVAFNYMEDLTGIENKLLEKISELEAEIANNYLGKDAKFSWSDIKDAPEIPEFSFNGDTVTLKTGNSSFTLPTNIQTAIQNEVNLSLKSQDFVTKDTLTMMGIVDLSNSGTNSDNTEPAIQLMNKQAEGYVITDFCGIFVRYLVGNTDVPREQYLQWPIKGNVIRGVYHPSTPDGTLSMMVDVTAATEVTINGIPVNVTKIKIDGRDPIFGLSCSYGDTKTLPWEVKLEGDSSSDDVGVRNFKTTISGYVTLTYTD